MADRAAMAGAAAISNRCWTGCRPCNLADLKHGDAIMVSTTEGTDGTHLTAIMMLAGVEPLLTASPNSTRDIMGGWNLGGGEGAAKATRNVSGSAVGAAPRGEIEQRTHGGTNERYSSFFWWRCWGQSAFRRRSGTGGVRGVLMDDSGAVIPATNVTVAGAGVSKTPQTQGDGTFSVTGLAPGQYTVSVEYPGFAPFSKAVDRGRRARRCR